MKNKTLLSIIIPCYNIEKYIEECLESVIYQFPVDSVEIIIVNDGSTDNTLNIIKTTIKGHKNIKLIEQTNFGLSVARNVGLEIAKSEYIYFVDGDDIVSINLWLEIKPFIELSNADIIEFDAIRFVGSEKNNHLFDSKTVYEDYFNNQKNLTHEEKILYLFTGSYRMVWSRIFKRSLIANFIFDAGRHYEDIIFVSEMYMNSKNIISIPRVLYYYRKREDSITANYKKSDVEDYLYIINYSISNANKSSINKAVKLYYILGANAWFEFHSIVFLFRESYILKPVLDTRKKFINSGVIKYFDWKKRLVIYNYRLFYFLRINYNIINKKLRLLTSKNLAD